MKGDTRFVLFLIQKEFFSYPESEDRSVTFFASVRIYNAQTKGYTALVYLSFTFIYYLFI